MPKNAKLSSAKPMDTITRKDIARAAGVSEKTVARRERKWGLHQCRSEAIHRPHLYFRDQVNRQLIPRRIFSAPL